MVFCPPSSGIASCVRTMWEVMCLKTWCSTAVWFRAGSNLGYMSQIIIVLNLLCVKNSIDKASLPGIVRAVTHNFVHYWTGIMLLNRGHARSPKDGNIEQQEPPPPRPTKKCDFKILNVWLSYVLHISRKQIIAKALIPLFVCLKLSSWHFNLTTCLLFRKMVSTYKEY